jgi:hypothetical protein
VIRRDPADEGIEPIRKVKTMISRLRGVLVGAFVVCAATLSAEAASLAPPTGTPILTVSGKIAETNGGEVARFDLAMLKALPGRVTETETPWTKGKTRFEGPLGTALLEAVGATGTTLRIVALNDYAVEVPVEDFRKWPVILAVTRDGQPMPVRDKGPIFVIYPFDLDPSLYNEKIFSRSAWQVKSIEVK